MRHAHLTLALLAPVLLAFAGSATAPESLRRKCRASAQKSPLMFVDGLPRAESEIDAMPKDDLWSVEVVCVDPVDTTILASNSVRTGIPAVVVWTKSGPASHLEPVLAALLAAQQAYVARTGAYSRDLASLRLAALPPEVKVNLEITATGWSASAWVDRRLTPRCRVAMTVELKGGIVCGSS